MPADGPVRVMDSGSTSTLRAGGNRFKINGWPPLVIGRKARSCHARSDTALVALAGGGMDAAGTVDCALVPTTSLCVGTASGLPGSKGSNNRCFQSMRDFPKRPIMNINSLSHGCFGDRSSPLMYSCSDMRMLFHVSPRPTLFIADDHVLFTRVS